MSYLGLLLRLQQWGESWYDYVLHSKLVYTLYCSPYYEPIFKKDKLLLLLALTDVQLLGQGKGLQGCK
jgi:hypothetical protein